MKCDGMMLDQLESPVLLAGNENCCYKDPAILYHGGVFHLYYSYTEIEEDGTVFMYVGGEYQQQFERLDASPDPYAQRQEPELFQSRQYFLF